MLSNVHWFVKQFPRVPCLRVSPASAFALAISFGFHKQCPWINKRLISMDQSSYSLDQWYIFPYSRLICMKESSPPDLMPAMHTDKNECFFFINFCAPPALHPQEQPAEQWPAWVHSYDQYFGLTAWDFDHCPGLCLRGLQGGALLETFLIPLGAFVLSSPNKDCSLFHIITPGRCK